MTMANTPFTIKVTSSDVPFLRAGFSLFIVPISIIYGILIMQFDVSLSLRVLLVGILTLFALNKLMSSITTIRVTTKDIIIITAFGIWVCPVSGILDYAIYTMPRSCYCSLTIQLLSGRRKKFHFVAPQTSAGSFCDTVKKLHDELYAVIRTNETGHNDE